MNKKKIYINSLKWIIAISFYSSTIVEKINKNIKESLLNGKEEKMKRRLNSYQHSISLKIRALCSHLNIMKFFWIFIRFISHRPFLKKYEKKTGTHVEKYFAFIKCSTSKIKITPWFFFVFFGASYFFKKKPQRVNNFWGK